MQKRAIASEFFSEMHSAQIRYAVFKSSVRMREAFNGQTDFDLLIEEADVSECQAIAKRLGFIIRGADTFTKGSRAIEMIGYDKKNSAVIHLSLHNPLVFGYKRIKNHQLPDTASLLSESKFNDSFNLYVMGHDFEAMLLTLRACLKGPALRHWAVKALKRDQGITWLPESTMQFELDELLSEVGDEQICQQAYRYTPKTVSLVQSFLVRYRGNTLRPEHLIFYRFRLQHLLRDHSVMPWYTYFAQRLLRALGKSRTVRSAQEGIVIAVVGADGSGKTTMVGQLHDWLSYKLACTRMYMGQRKRHPIRKAITVTRSAIYRFRLARLGSYCDSALALFDAKSRMKSAIKAEQLAQSGGIVVSDRWPIDAFTSMDKPMDGPRLRPGDFGFFRERKYYERVYSIPVEIVALDVDPHTALGRHATAGRKAPDTETLEQKIEAVRRLNESSGNSLRHFTVTARQNAEPVTPLLDVKNHIWDLIVARN